MNVQSVSALVTTLVILVIAVVFINIRRHAHEAREYAPVQGTAYRYRAILFWVMIVVGLPITVYLLRDMPYATAAGTTEVVNATGAQWYWDLDKEEFTTGQKVEFNVTSTDVNHGFGLYDQHGTLVAQVQAMPGYINRLTYQFTTPGTYKVMCLEYCGLVHHDMILDLTVADGNGGSNE